MSIYVYNIHRPVKCRRFLREIEVLTLKTVQDKTLLIRALITTCMTVT